MGHERSGTVTNIHTSMCDLRWAYCSSTCKHTKSLYYFYSLAQPRIHGLHLSRSIHPNLFHRGHAKGLSSTFDQFTRRYIKLKISSLHTRLICHLLPKSPKNHIRKTLSSLDCLPPILNMCTDIIAVCCICETAVKVTTDFCPDPHCNCIYTKYSDVRGIEYWICNRCQR